MADDVEIKLKNVRASFLHIFEPQDRKNDAGEVTGKNYNGSFLIPKKDVPGEKPVSAVVKGVEVVGATAVLKALKDAMATARVNEWGTSPPKFAPDQLCLRDGEPIDPDSVQLDENEQPIPGTGTRVALYDGYLGCMYVSANRPVKLDDFAKIKAGQKKVPVRVIGPRKNRETGKFDIIASDAEPFAPYSGAYVTVILRIYGYNGTNGQKSRINASLEAVQFVRDGESFGARGVDVDSAFDEEEVGDEDMGGAAAPAAAAAGGDDDFNIG